MRLLSYLEGVTMPWGAIIRYVIPGILGALFVLQIMSWRDDSLKLVNVEHELSTCHTATTKLKEVNDALQKSRDAVASRLAAAKRVRSACIPIQQSNPIKTGAEHAGSHGAGLTSDWLLEYAAQCEIYRSERIELEKL